MMIHFHQHFRLPVMQNISRGICIPKIKTNFLVMRDLKQLISTILKWC